MEDIINKAEGKVQVIFEKTGDKGSYRDALWFSEEDYDKLTPNEISDMQDERYNNWYAIVAAMPTE
jgi:hypothetical protein